MCVCVFGVCVCVCARVRARVCTRAHVRSQKDWAHTFVSGLCVCELQRNACLCVNGRVCECCWLNAGAPWLCGDFLCLNLF